MLIKADCYNIKCDCCGTFASEEEWLVDEDTAKQEAEYSEFLHLGDKDYCPDCYHYDDNNRIITKDGRVFDEDTLEEITI